MKKQLTTVQEHDLGGPQAVRSGPTLPRRALVLGGTVFAGVAVAGAGCAATAAPPSRGQDEAAAEEVAERCRRWVLGWDKVEGGAPFVFRDVFGDLYDYDGGDVVYYDNFDPEHRVIRSAADYEATWEPVFNSLRSAEHWIALEPEVVVSGDHAHAFFIFLARLTTGDGTVIHNRATSALVWRETADGWAIMRDHTSSVALTPEAFTTAVRAAESTPAP